MDLDHIFIFISPDGPEISRLAALGLSETYRRKHPGQGTENVCYAFDNLFLELLWINDASEAASEAVRRTGLLERSRWRGNGACPFGISWRGDSPGVALWDYRPPYLPEGVGIPVAVDSDNTHLPMMFRSPGNLPPSEWPADRRGSLQHGAGLSVVTDARLTLPDGVAPGPALRQIADRTVLSLGSFGSTSYRLDLTIRCMDGGSVKLKLPAFDLS